MTRAVLSAGSNIGDSLAHLSTVVRGFSEHLVAVSGVYATEPWGGVQQQDFHNITLIVEADHDAHTWLRLAHDLENAADRVRDVRWGPRTLDVDVISVTDAEGPVLSADPDLTLPHPRAMLRAFVLVPWLEIDPDAMLWSDGRLRRVDELLAALPPAEVTGVRRVAESATADSGWLR